MALRELPVQDLVAYEMKVDLDNIPYSFVFTFNDRVKTWTFSIFDDAGTELISGIPVFVNALLLENYQHDDRLPQGNLFAVNLVDDASPPNEDNLGTDVVIFYEDAV